MKKLCLTVLVLCMMGIVPANATVYNDAVGEALGNWGHLDIVSVEVSNDATHITFIITLGGDPIATNWGKYLVGIDNVAGGDTASNGWGRAIAMSAGMDYFIGSWADSGGGAETYSWDGDSWNRDNATYSSPSDIEIPVITTSSITLKTSLASLGLSHGDSFVFDVFTTGGGGQDTATDALSDPLQTAGEWSVPYSSTSSLSYTVVVDKAYAPAPANGEIVGTNIGSLSWTNPAPTNPADTITCDVYFLDAGTSPLTADPNMGPIIADPGVIQIANDITDETVALPGSVLPLQDDHYYYWKVHATDPNTPGNPVTAQGYLWYFFAGDAAPEPSKPLDQYMWLGQDDAAIGGIGDTNPNIRYFEVTASYTDDGKSPIADVNMVNLNWDWANGQLGIAKVSQVHDPVAKTVTAVYRTIWAEGGDPDNTTVLPGYWAIRLEVTDGTGTVQGAQGIHRIFATCGEAAEADPADDFDGYYDTNDDCIVNLADFADFAAKWLYQGSKYE
ncbi:MAG: hypothetical protein LLF76_13840 [Planctomycetaceae bacterium]|nr:hypothetical protein [Planctomycetaceae bacterium]